MRPVSSLAYASHLPSGENEGVTSTKFVATTGNAFWSPKVGKELYFWSTDQQLMAVDIQQNGASLQLGAPHALFKATTVVGAAGTYTASADGKKFVMNTVLPQSISEPLTLVTNWPADLKQ